MAHPVQTESVESLLLELEADTEHMRKVMMENVTPPGSPMYPLDFLAFAAAKRHASTTSAFIAMIRSWNMVIARALLRMHIDTSLRFSAAWHVSDPHKFSTSVLKGERIDKMKTRTGHRLTDAHLVQLHQQTHPWLPVVYERLSGYVHFSGAHISDSIEGVGEDDSMMQFLISDQDLKYPEYSWVEILECFRETTSILETFLQGWGATKRLSDAQLSALRGGV
jgi:hypothetical protein